MMGRARGSVWCGGYAFLECWLWGGRFGWTILTPLKREKETERKEERGKEEKKREKEDRILTLRQED